MTTLVGSAKGTDTAHSMASFILNRLAPFVGHNIDCVGAQMEEIALGAGYWFRWLEPSTEISSEDIPYRVNVHVTNGHKITRITVG